jgi:type IV pilus modification protein PilV
MLIMRRRSHAPKRVRARSGFTLVELLVALMIFSVGALAMVATAANVMTLITSSKNRTLAASVAEARFEQMRSQPCAAHKSDNATTRGIAERWLVVPVARADDVTVQVSFVSNRRVQTRTYQSFLPC